MLVKPHFLQVQKCLNTWKMGILKDFGINPLSCPNCKTKEFIPLDIVQKFDLLDSDGVDNSYPPRFQCLNCGDNMVPIYYKSIHGIIHEYKES